MIRHLISASAIAVAASMAMAAPALARDQIRIVGSSTVFPFSTAVAEQFGKTTSFKTPVIESTGSGGGFKLFCAGVGTEHPDITNASRKIKSSEIENCAKNGVKDIVEVVVGFDGIVLASSKNGPDLKLTRKQIFQALAKQVPVDGKLVANPYKKWSDIDSSLPDEKIEVLGPPPTSGTRDAFVELAMEAGAEEFPMIEKMGKGSAQVAGAMREDGAFIEAGENDNLIVQKLEANPAAIGIFGFSYLDQNADKLKGAAVNGTMPTFENIADGKYDISRSLQFYIKKAHVGTIPGIKEYAEEFTSERAFGEDGYLADKGLIPLPEDKREEMHERVENMTASSS